MGSGETINIVGQPWLLDGQNPYITSNVQFSDQSKVSSLMAVDYAGWDEEILNDLFNERDRRCIRNVRLRVDEGRDRMYWSKESSGQYSVRSAYRLLQVQKHLWRHARR